MKQDNKHVNITTKMLILLYSINNYPKIIITIFVITKNNNNKKDLLFNKFSNFLMKYCNVC